jgi:meso-butanediol dehydrogenase / (S,S)-butanediol dehydrogenase / diacetyl reductase
MMQGRLAGKIAVITAAGAGLGRACAIRYAHEGATVIVNALHEETAEATANEIRDGGGSADFVAGSVADSDFVRELISFAVRRYGRIDLLHNNAADTRSARVAEMDEVDWLQVFEVTLHGTFYGMRAVLPIMIEQRSGVILNTTSLSGLGGASHFGAYGAAKAAVENLSRVAAIENARFGVRVNVICPGTIASRHASTWLESLPGGRQAYEDQIPQRRVGEPEEIASAAVFLASDEASYITGASMVVDGGVSARVALPIRLPVVPED